MGLFEKGLILDEIFKALGYLFIAFIVYSVAYKKALEASEKNGFKKTLWEGFLWCGGFAIIMAIMLGSPSCIEKEYGPQGNICIEYADDGYTPTNEERASKFAYFMTLFYIPVVIGAYQKKGVYEIEKSLNEGKDVDIFS